MNELIMLHGTKVRKILELLIERRIPANMTYSIGHNWQTVRVLLTYIEDNRFDIKITPVRKNQCTMLTPGQMVGIAFKGGFGLSFDNFIFDTTVVQNTPASGSLVDGDLCLSIPEQIEMVQRRNYQRVKVPGQIGNVDVLAWHHIFAQDNQQILDRKEFHFELVDISASGIQVAIPADRGPDFKPGQSIAVKFVAIPGETPLMFSAQVKSILSTADSQNLCFGLQTVGLEASPEGRLILQRLCSAVEQYKQMISEAKTNNHSA